MLIVTASFSMPIEEVVYYTRGDLLQQVLFEVHNYFMKNIGNAMILSENFHRSDDSVKITLEIQPSKSSDETLIQNSALLLKHWGRGAFNRSSVTVKKRGEVDLCAVNNEPTDTSRETIDIENATTMYVVYDTQKSNRGIMLSASRPTVVREIDMLIYNFLIENGLKPIHQEICIIPRESENTLSTIMIVVPTRDEIRVKEIKNNINTVLSFFFSKVVITHYRSVSNDLYSL